MSALSKRLSTIASLVPPNARACDVGTDHAFLPIFLMNNGKAQSVIATDINEKPLKKAIANVEKSGAKGISLRLCDGLEGVEKGEVDTVIIAGIGGEVISGIIDRAGELLKDSAVTLIIQPTTSPEFLRKFLYSNGFSILKEIAVEENGKLYSVMECGFTGLVQKWDEWFYFVGLVDSKEENGAKYIDKQKMRCFKCMTALENNISKAEEFEYYKNVYNSLKEISYGI